MLFGWLYTKCFMRNGSVLFNFWCWLAYQRWYHILLIPMHIIKGYYYKYSTKQIYYFCKGCLYNKIYEKQFRNKII